MSPNRSRKHLQRAFWGLGVLLLVAVCLAGTLLVMVGQQRIAANSRAQTLSDLVIIGQVVSREYAVWDVSSAARLLGQWAQERSAVLALRATTADGQLIADYQNQKPARSTFTVATQVAVNDQQSINLTVTQDFSQIADALMQLALRYLIFSIIAFVVLWQALWFFLRHVVLDPMQLTEANLFAAQQRAQKTLSSIGDAVITTDTHARIESINEVAESLTTWKNKEAMGQPMARVIPLLNERTREPVACPAQLCLQKVASVRSHEPITLVNEMGREIAVEHVASPIKDQQGSIIGTVVVLRDVSEARSLSKKIAYQAVHDPLTGLINRLELENRLRRAIDSAKLNNLRHAFLYIDLDQFKIVNDTCGHVAGDALLRGVTEVLAKRVRNRDTLARLGGDEFGLLLEYCLLDNAMSIAESVLSDIRDYTFVWNQHTFQIGCSIGLVPITSDSGGLTDVLSHADAACYAAKAGGRNRIQLCRQVAHEARPHLDEVDWVARITRALHDQRFVLAVQKVVTTDSDRNADTEVYEVLIRLQDEHTGEYLVPGAFLPSAERYSLMGDIDRWVVAHIFRWINDRPPLAPYSGSLSINISLQSMQSRAFIEYLQEQLGMLKIAPERICLELTEAAVIANFEVASQFVRDVKQLGCQVALDKFGQGLCSFSHLRQLPVDMLKIDGNLIHDIEHDAIDLALVKSINEIGHAQGMATVAEHVENDSLMTAVKSLGIDYVQGFIVAKPQLIAHSKLLH